MHPETRTVSAHMKDFGFSLLGRAICDATFSEMMRPFAHATTVTLAAQSAEILIKAKIAEEHPLLIFSKLPHLSSTSGALTMEELFEYGRSYMYEDLPNLLWATTSLRLEGLEEFRSFGHLRNKIMHFAVPNIDLPKATLSFAINVMEPFTNLCWGESAIHHAEEWDEAIVEDGYLKDRLLDYEFNLTPRLKEILEKDE